MGGSDTTNKIWATSTAFVIALRLALGHPLYSYQMPTVWQLMTR